MSSNKRTITSIDDDLDYETEEEMLEEKNVTPVKKTNVISGDQLIALLDKAREIENEEQTSPEELVKNLLNKKSKERQETENKKPKLVTTTDEVSKVAKQIITVEKNVSSLQQSSQIVQENNHPKDCHFNFNVSMMRCNFPECPLNKHVKYQPLGIIRHGYYQCTYPSCNTISHVINYADGKVTNNFVRDLNFKNTKDGLARKYHEWKDKQSQNKEVVGITAIDKEKNGDEDESINSSKGKATDTAVESDDETMADDSELKNIEPPEETPLHYLAKVILKKPKPEYFIKEEMLKKCIKTIGEKRANFDPMLLQVLGFLSLRDQSQIRTPVEHFYAMKLLQFFVDAEVHNSGKNKIVCETP
jgi:hypothetical protein